MVLMVLMLQMSYGIGSLFAPAMVHLLGMRLGPLCSVSHYLYLHSRLLFDACSLRCLFAVWCLFVLQRFHWPRLRTSSWPLQSTSNRTRFCTSLAYVRVYTLFLCCFDFSSRLIVLSCLLLYCSGNGIMQGLYWNLEGNWMSAVSHVGGTGLRSHTLTRSAPFLFVVFFSFFFVCRFVECSLIV